MGRPKLDSFWYVFVAAAGIAIAASLYNCATAPPRERLDVEELWAGLFAIIGVGLLILGLRLFAVRGSRQRTRRDRTAGR